jgi:hypothetical protein
MNPLVMATLILGGVCLGFLIWLYRQREDYESLLAIKDAAFAVQVKNSEIMMKGLTDELEKYKNKEDK